MEIYLFYPQAPRPYLSMARSSSRISTTFALALLLLFLFLEGSSACLSRKFYVKSCPPLFKTVRPLVHSALSKEPRTGASLVRLFFHDCFVQGCDASLLLEDTANFKGEQTAITNVDSLNPKAFDVIDEIRTALEKVCPGVVSCADILTIAARDSVEILGGPLWSVKLGRRDSTTANFTAAESDIPAPFFNLNQLIASFEKKKLSARDMVALSGSHTIGQSRCTSFRAHIYNGSNIDSSFAKLRKANCPAEEGSGDGNLAPLDVRTPTVFDNSYFKNLLKSKGLLNSDQELFNGSSTDSLVKTYSRRKSAFFSDFVAGMIRMGNLDPLIGSQGEIRKNCRRIN